MLLLNPSLLFGLILAAVPILLHLIMRARPKRIEFPALRLLQVRRTANARRMKLRQVLLLALRMLLIAAIVLAFARPSLPAADYALRWWEWLGLIISAAGAFAAARWLQRRSSARPGSVQSSQQQSIQRVLCLLGGLAAAFLLTALPWAIRVRAELLSPGSEGAEDVPVAAVFLLDNSLSMDYLHENKTRLEAARLLARQQLERFPAGSLAAVASLNSADDFVFQADLAGASAKLDGINPAALPRQLNPQIRNAIKAHVEHRSLVQQEATLGPAGDLFAREIYVLSDFTTASVRIPDESGLADLLKQHQWLHIYLVDLSVPNPLNAGIAELTLSDEAVTPGLKLDLALTVRAVGALPPSVNLEASIIGPDGQETRAAAPAVVKLEGSEVRVQTSIDVPQGLTQLQGLVRLNLEDPLAADNTRWFSCGVLPTPKVLLISDRLEETLFIKNALQPEERERAGFRTCECRRITTAAAGEQPLADFNAVFLVSPQRPDDTLWSALANYASNGGSVLVVAGSPRILPIAWNSPVAARLLPAAPITPIRFLDEPAHLRIAQTQHPVTRGFAADETLRVGIASAAFERCWAVEPATDAQTLFSFSGPAERPALLERRVGRGRALLFSSAMDNLPDGGSQWNNLPNEWSFIALLEKLLLHLAGNNELRRNFIAGELIELPIPTDQRFQQFLLQRPGLAQTRGSVEPAQRSIPISDAHEIGHYLLRPFESRSSFSANFSVNPPPAETDLTPINPEQFKALFNSDRVTPIRSPAELQDVVRTGRLGVEIFPVLLGLLLLLLSAEHLMANHFYDEHSATPAPPPSRA
jgi:hypothetical protein